MTDMERKAVVKISRDMCLSCAHNPSIEECHLMLQKEARNEDEDQKE